MHAQAELPLTSETLLVGSQDAGLTVKSNDSELSTKLQLAAAQLNLKEHLGRGGARLHLGCDVEGHRGADGVFYVVCAKNTSATACYSCCCVFRFLVDRQRLTYHLRYRVCFTIWFLDSWSAGGCSASVPSRVAPVDAASDA